MVGHGQNVGYIRVSSAGQNTGRQLDGIQLDKIFEEKISAKNMERPELVSCLDYVRSGDTLFCHSIDRLARSLTDLETIAKKMLAKNVTLKFVKEGLTIDGNMHSNLIMQIFGAIAEWERCIIAERRNEGIAKAREKGVQFGRKLSFTKIQIEEIMTKIADGEKIAAIANDFSCARGTIYNLLKRENSKS